MTDDNKPPMFSLSFVIDSANHDPRSGKSFWMAATDVDALASKACPRGVSIPTNQTEELQ